MIFAAIALVTLTITCIYLLCMVTKLSDQCDMLKTKYDVFELHAISEAQSYKELKESIDNLRERYKKIDEDLVAIRVRLAECEDTDTDILKKIGDTQTDLEKRMDNMRDILFDQQNEHLKSETEIDKLWVELAKFRVDIYERGKPKPIAS